MNEKLYNKIADYYDLFEFSDYEKQGKFISSLIKKNFGQNTGSPVKILDLACGTGEHIKILKKEYETEGIDLNEGMLKVAKNKNPGAKIAKGDLCNLILKNGHYDAIICLSSSIQYILKDETLKKTFGTIHSALRPGGLFIFDLAYCKDNWQEGYVGIRTAVKDNLQIAEIFKSRSKDNISYYNPLYLINDNGKVDFFIDEHKIYLYTIKEIKKISGDKFKSVKIYADYAQKPFDSSKKNTPVFVLKK